MTTPPVASIRSVSKRFGATLALDDVSLELFGGEVHVLAGENGAGKSTLIRILAGVLTDYDGEVSLVATDGSKRPRPVQFAHPGDARAAGIATIHQELSLVGAMSVADNFILGRPGGFWRPVARQAERKHTQAALDALRLTVPLDARVETLPLATRQLVEIARALAWDARVLIMDEPTSALSDAETHRLFSELDTLRERGVAVVFISHRMAEIYQVADRITVLRDGKLITSKRAHELPEEQLVASMLGQAPALAMAVVPAHRADVAVRVKDLTVMHPSGRRVLDGLSLTLHRGEVLGVAGLSGSGVDVLPLAIFGAIDARGEIALNESPVPVGSVRDAMARGIVLCSGDRRASVITSMSVADNINLSRLAVARATGVRDRGDEVGRAKAAHDALDIVCASLDAEVGHLSGGNQQKVALARCLEVKPSVLLLVDPTRGVDVGAKAEVARLIGSLSERGVGVLLVSSDLEELIALAHRIVVMVRGRIVDERMRGDFSRESVLAAAMGGVA